jgi:hypothetical protein
MHKWIGKLVLILLFSAIISYIYVKQATIDPASLIRNQSTFQVPPPFGLRFLLPSIISSVLPFDSYDTDAFRFTFAFISVALCFVVIQPFERRVLNGNDGALDPVLPLALCLLLLCHYCLSRRLNVYYVYDFPAILFYMISFLLLTSKSPRVTIFGILFTVLFSMNRETIVIAPLHAAALVIFRDWSTRRQFLARTLAPIVGTLVIIILLRTLLAYSIYGFGLLGTITTYEDETPRFLANVRRVINEPRSEFQLLLFGAGAIVWLPLFFPKISDQLKLMLLFSMPALLMLLWAGNFVELRVYNEFVPLLAVLLSQASAYFFKDRKQHMG